DGLSPSISIEQKTVTSHPRSTVGTVTNIYDFLRLLYARVGEVRDPETGESLKAHTDDDITTFIKSFDDQEKVQLFASVVRGKKGEYLREFEQWRRAGFTKVRIDGKMHDLHDPILIAKNQHHDIDILVDSLTPARKELAQRIKETMMVCDKVAEGWLRICIPAKSIDKLFSRKVASATSGISLPELEPRIFSFNSPYGMCPKCRGLGFIDKESVAKRKKLLEDDEDDLLVPGLESAEVCPECHGGRLRKESLCVFFNGHNIAELSNLTCAELSTFLLRKDSKQSTNAVAARLIDEITTRLKFLSDVGVGYLTLGRPAGTLSGGEAQRIRLATQLGSQLSGVLYVLDEPSIGLHPRDHQKLLGSLKRLRDLGNTVVVVEHDEETMLFADHIIDIGPGAGVHGGHVVAEGSPTEIQRNKNSVTGSYLAGTAFVTSQRARRKGNGLSLSLKGCNGHNLKNVDLNLPLGKLVVVTGVSGSGKSSLIEQTLEVALAKKLYRSTIEPLPFKSLEGVEHIDKLVHVDQRPIGRSPRSNPATYTGLFAFLRNVFAQSPEAQIRGYTQGTFSFNVKGGRCDACEGAGRVKIEMHFLPDVYVPCETCHGSRYRREVLEVRFKGKSIADALNMSIEEAHAHFQNQPLIEPKLRTLVEVGLGYVRLGQPATTLSGGEAQRIKLAKELSKRSTGKTIYFLDEPTTGLHFQDIKKLLEIIQRLCDLGNSVVIIEHNLDVICAADHIIDVGPDSGALGGSLVLEGTPEDFAKFTKASSTAPFVKEYFKARNWKA
ncbi:MAG: excinuclease ABC subunit UvrA, partial [Bdellovibrionales bacterium]|nr:excinuclease ABC subunit UvrA [Bdellovibrionales bacterium]